MSRWSFQRLTRSAASLTSLRPRLYHSDHHPLPFPFSEVEDKILAAAMSHVPASGFSSRSLLAGSKDAGYCEATKQLFPRGVFHLIQYHLVTQRRALSNKVQFPEHNTPVGQKVRTLTLQRLRANEPIIHQWQGVSVTSSYDCLRFVADQPSPQALTYLASIANFPMALSELQALADEVWYLAGDTSVNPSWYTKRASLAALYASSEIFMTTDTSPQFTKTEEFLDDRLANLRQAGNFVGGLGRYVGFWAGSSLNLARSWGMRI